MSNEQLYSHGQLTDVETSHKGAEDMIMVVGKMSFLICKMRKLQ